MDLFLRWVERNASAMKAMSELANVLTAIVAVAMFCIAWTSLKSSNEQTVEYLERFDSTIQALGQTNEFSEQHLELESSPLFVVGDSSVVLDLDQNGKYLDFTETPIVLRNVGRSPAIDLTYEWQDTGFQTPHTSGSFPPFVFSKSEAVTIEPGAELSILPPAVDWAEDNQAANGTLILRYSTPQTKGRIARFGFIAHKRGPIKSEKGGSVHLRIQAGSAHSGPPVDLIDRIQLRMLETAEQAEGR